jgi:hypothetical protein
MSDIFRFNLNEPTEDPGVEYFDEDVETEVLIHGDQDRAQMLATNPEDPQLDTILLPNQLYSLLNTDPRIVTHLERMADSPVGLPDRQDVNWTSRGTFDGEYCYMAAKWPSGLIVVGYTPDASLYEHWMQTEGYRLLFV